MKKFVLTVSTALVVAAAAAFGGWPTAANTDCCDCCSTGVCECAVCTCCDCGTCPACNQ